MYVSKINNKSTFGSKVRIQKNLSDLVISYNQTRNTLLNNVKKIENNGNNDIVILSGKTKIDKYNGIEDTILMQVIEKKNDGYFITPRPIENLIDKIDKNGTLHTLYNLEEMYNQAKNNMTKLSNEYEKFIKYF